MFWLAGKLCGGSADVGQLSLGQKVSLRRWSGLKMEIVAHSVVAKCPLSIPSHLFPVFSFFCHEQFTFLRFTEEIS